LPAAIVAIPILAVLFTLTILFLTGLIFIAIIWLTNL
jgi:hypothetical protein